MGLRMSSPFRHPVTGIFWFRRRVPSDLISLVGKREEKFTLGTRDPAEAKAAWARVAAEVEARWGGLRGGFRTLTNRQMHALAGEFYRTVLEAGENKQPSLAELQWECALDMFAREALTKSMPKQEKKPEIRKELHELSTSLRRDQVRTFLLDRGIVVRPDDLDRVVEVILRGTVQARKLLLRYQEGNFRPDPEADRFPNWEQKRVAAPKLEDELPESFYNLVAIYGHYADEAGHSVSTRKKWRAVIAQAAATHPDVRSITPIWCVEWKDCLLKRGLSTKSVQEGYLAALRSTLGWAVRNKRISSNPMEGISVRIVQAGRERSKGYTDQEAAFVLGLTVKPIEGVRSPLLRAARRWVPWLCAYTGARVGEVAQLRKQDVVVRDEVYLLWITPEAGTTKSGDARWVALHPHLIGQGFLRFVSEAKTGPLFYDPVRPRGGSAENPPAKKVGERLAAWIRDEGMTEKISPSHAWRHRFKTLARVHGIDPGARDYMQGHAAASEGEAYGEYPPSVLLAEISKLPSYTVPGLILSDTKDKQPSPIGDLTVRRHSAHFLEVSAANE